MEWYVLEGWEEEHAHAAMSYLKWCLWQWAKKESWKQIGGSYKCPERGDRAVDQDGDNDPGNTWSDLPTNFEMELIGFGI